MKSTTLHILKRKKLRKEHPAMEDDDMDFTPSPKTSSNLASLFGFTKKPLQGNASLTYTAPKAPKNESSPTKKESEEKTKGKIIFSKAVQAYKLENRTYVNQGLIGVVISGNHDSRIYQIILYKRTKEHLSQIKISSSFSITLSSNNYASFYDNNKQNWFIMFHSSGDIEQFSQKVAICKFYSQPEPPSDILIQDLGPATQKKATPNSVVEIIYSSYTLIPEELTKLKGEIREKIKLSNYDFTHLSKGLINCAENCKRVIIIPHSLSENWINELGPNKDLLIEVKLEKIVKEEAVVFESKLSGDGPPESPIESSAEDTSIKVRGTSLKEALTSTKSQKASLISRMARMGQATLPIKQGELSAAPSDSEGEGSAMSSPKPRFSKMRTTISSPSLNNSFSQIQNSEASQQLSVYQNDFSWKQAQLNEKLGVTYQHLIPASAGPISSPSNDLNLSVYVSESRIQAAELRMGISKISEKLDLVWNKIQAMNGSEVDKSHRQALVDSGGILASIQNLITENENLKKKIDEQKEKIEQQNDRIFHLLELNHKYLEQNSTSHEKQSATETKLKAEMESLQRKEVEMEASNKIALDKLRSLKRDLTKSEEVNKELKKKLEEFKVDAETSKRNLEQSDDKVKELESLKERNSKASETIVLLKEKLKEIVSENEKLKSVIEVQKEQLKTRNLEINDARTKNEEYVKAVESLKNQISEEELKTESKIETLSKVVAKLKDENTCLMEKIETGKEISAVAEKNDQSEIKNILPKILLALNRNLNVAGSVYTEIYSEFMQEIEEIFTSVINGTFKLEEEPKGLENESFKLKSAALPTSRTSLQNLEPVPKNKEETEPLEPETKERSSKELDKKQEKREIDSVKKKEVDGRYKSYDQSWRTARPPPPPVFDDDDEDDDYDFGLFD